MGKAALNLASEKQRSAANIINIDFTCMIGNSFAFFTYTGNCTTSSYNDNLFHRFLLF